MAEWSSLPGIPAMLAYLAALFMVVAILMTTIRRLRVLALAAGLAAFCAFALSPDGAVGMVLSGLFFLANGVQLAAIVRRARSGAMLEDEHTLFERHLLIDNRANRSKLRDLIEWRDVAAGEVLMRQGDRQPPLLYLAQGSASIEHDGRHVGSCATGEFIGEMSLLMANGASATVTADEPLRIARFDRDALAQLARAVPEVERALSAALNRGLGNKIMRMNLAAGSTFPESSKSVI